MNTSKPFGHDFGGSYETVGMPSIPNQHVQTAEAILNEKFPNRHNRKINWLQFEQDLRDALRLKIDNIDKLYVIDLLIGEHTGRGYELPYEEFEGSLRDNLKGLS